MFLIVHGHHTSTKTPVEYLEHIVYGSPRIDAVLVGSTFVGIIEYADGDVTINYTFERLGSFGSIGCSLTGEPDVALREFGIWVRHAAPGSIANQKEDDRAKWQARLEEAKARVGV